MMQRRVSLIAYLLAIVFVAGNYAGCTYYVPAQLMANRTGDTLTVELERAGRWEPDRDSLVVECAKCDPANSRLVEHFQFRRDAAFEIVETQDVRLSLYTFGRLDTSFVLLGVGSAEANAVAPSMRRTTPHRRTATEPTAEETAAAAKAKAAEKVKKTPTQLKVTATEGVAIYKDKTKREVLKIVPQGTVLKLLSREGDLYSVGIEGGEGFVEAEAVAIQE